MPPPTQKKKPKYEYNAAGHHGLDRLVEIHRILKNGETPTALELAERLGYHRKTICRSLNYLKEERGHPIEYDARTRRYSYTGDAATLPDVTVTEQEVFTLFFASKILAQYEGTPMHSTLNSVLQKLSNGLRGTVTFGFNGMDNALAVVSAGIATPDASFFPLMQQAIRDGEELEFNYSKGAGGETECRQMQPWKLACINNQWYLFGYDLLRRDQRTFALTRMSDLRKTGRYFKPVRDFDLDGHLSGSFGVFAGNESHDIHLRFSPRIARRISERQWHPRQKLTPLPDGGLDFHIHLNSLKEILRWILSWGKYCTVIAPDCLREMVIDEARKLIELNSSQSAREKP